MTIAADVNQYLGPHPAAPHPFGKCLEAVDGLTQKNTPHRALSEIAAEHVGAVQGIRDMLVRHHASADEIDRSRRLSEAVTKLGYRSNLIGLRRFPRTETTRKGNLAEVVLAEYVVATTGCHLPVYKLRYNPNVEQAMKGDDVLAFDLDSEPARIIVGEAKFRGTPTKAVLEEIVGGLLRSHQAGIPISLQFVADRLRGENRAGLAERIENCALLFAARRLRIDYAGLLVSDFRVRKKVEEDTPDNLRNLVMVSLSLTDPNNFVEACFDGLN